MLNSAFPTVLALFTTNEFGYANHTHNHIKATRHVRQVCFYVVIVQIRMTMGDYISYMRSQSDEMPLYIFDSKFAKKCPSLLQDYNAHTSFPWLRHDLFEPLGVSHRPDFRWLVIGPARTGAPFHVDPNHTSAWNMCVSGRKRWALYPPNCIPPG